MRNTFIFIIQNKFFKMLILFLKKKDINSYRLDENCVLLLNDGYTVYELNENDTNNFTFKDYSEKRCSKKRTLLHLIAESGLFKYVRNCFNKITLDNINELKDENHKTPIQIAQDNKYRKKWKIFTLINHNENKEKNTILHKLVILNQMKLLNDLLLYLSEHCLIDTIGFGLKNKNDKTPFEIAVENENSEAIFLLNHYEFNDNKSTNKYDY